MERADVIIVGAGACGLMTARKLSGAGKKVIILEARDRTGGRIHTLEDAAYPAPLEAGAEFIHGKLPVTMQLLKEAGIRYRESGGESWRFSNNTFTQDEDAVEGGEALMKKLGELQQDITVATFLDTYFNGPAYEGLRESVKGFVEGYDAADITRASIFTFRKEWTGMEDWEQFRVNGGYIDMIRFLEKESKSNGSQVFLNSIVKEITWRHGHVEVTTAGDDRYTADKIVVSVPLGVLCSGKNDKANMRFSPSLPKQETAFKALGYGGVIKIILVFQQAFWREHEGTARRKLSNMGWLFSTATIPTWWTQVPDDSAILTGWLAGPNAERHRYTGNAEILTEALQILGVFFRKNREEMMTLLVHHEIINWLADPFAIGAYSYATTASAEAIKQVSIPVENTLFFAGEAFYDGPEIGTVEGALANGLEVASRVLDSI